ncbi:hypothetical protein BGW38_010623 [Lunasporangiospora selenospora]|uniref:Eisosome component PIL1-domain-containing protein n=1 Tax=Lunasporangiospora selenospora TaxID=979761 RepID=A0A9P6FWS3_9FUNG|nr:hypothetical protein BGW38_010623 [Lunasporangiospora selenospora]
MDGARYAAGSFLSPLTNAIGEQRRLVESLAVVSKVRVEECKHMMVWSKSQTEDLADVLLKLNLLVRKISDYETQFGNQYEQFRDKIKHLRSKDDTPCEMGQKQAELQQKITEVSKSTLRAAKNYLRPKDPETTRKANETKDAKLDQLKRKLIKEAYTTQLDGIIELGKKMQIIGDHGKLLLHYIDQPSTLSASQDGRETESVLQTARIALENWNQPTMTDIPDHTQYASQTTPPPATTTTAQKITSPIVTVSPDSDDEEDPPLTKNKRVSTGPANPLPPLPPRREDSSYSPDSLVSSNDDSCHGEQSVAEAQEIERAIALSIKDMNEKKSRTEGFELTAEEERFVNEINISSGVVSSGSTSGTAKKDEKKESALLNTQTDIVAPKVTSIPKIVRNPQVVDPASNAISKQGPRPWTPANEQEMETNASAQSNAGGIPKTSEPSEEPIQSAISKPVTSTTEEETLSTKTAKRLSTSSTTSTQKVLESLGGSEVEKPLESLGRDAEERPLESMGSSAPSRPLESMGGEHSAPPLESMGSETPQPLESMGAEPTVVAESMGRDGYDAVPRLGIDNSQYHHQQFLQGEQSPLSPLPPTPELQYLDIGDSPSLPPSPAFSSTQHTPQTTFVSTIASVPMQPMSSMSGTYQSCQPYQPSTRYIPQPSRQKNRLSGSHIQSASDSGVSGGSSPYYQQQQQQYGQQQYQQQQYQQYTQQQYTGHQSHSDYSPQPYQQHQLQQFYYTPAEQQQEPHNSQLGRSNSYMWKYPVYPTSISPDPSLYRDEHQSSPQFQR